MWGLASVVGDESYSGREGAKLSFGGEVEGRETPGQGKDLAEVMAG